jgi:putative lipoic acid-binding regulatory protein
VEIFDKLKEQLMLQEWPNVYFFKFIVPSDSEKLAQVTSFFDTNAEITMHPSKTRKYTSVSAKTVMMDVDSIIELYERAAAIPGVISL